MRLCPPHDVKENKALERYTRLKSFSYHVTVLARYFSIDVTVSRESRYRLSIQILHAGFSYKYTIYKVNSLQTLYYVTISSYGTLFHTYLICG